MRKSAFALLGATAIFVSAPALAQDDASGQDQPAAAPAASDAPTAPDGSKAFGIDPYFGVMGGYEQFDAERNPANVPDQGLRHDKLKGGLVQGVIGFNVPLGPVFVGAEGNVTKGFTGDIDWEYGAAGRFGVRAGESGLFYGKVGYQWVNFARFGDNSRDYHDITYGIGAEFGPKDIGLAGASGRGQGGLRMRVEVSTFGAAHSFRPMAGVIAHF